MEKVNRESEHIQQEDVDALKALGWTDEALYDAVTVCALFNFYNRWNDATGVRGHPLEVYQRTASRLAQPEGYLGQLPPPPKPEK